MIDYNLPPEHLFCDTYFQDWKLDNQLDNIGIDKI